MGKLIEGQVAQILSENYIVVNRGSNAGVKVGMVFAVLAQGQEVRDPETGDVLGQWEVPKGYIRATHVQERLCTCEGYTSGQEPGQKKDSSTEVLSAAMIQRSMSFDTSRTRMNVNRSQVEGMPAVGPISVSDTVREFRPEPAASEPTEKVAPPKPDETQAESKQETQAASTPETKPAQESDKKASSQ